MQNSEEKDECLTSSGNIANAMLPAGIVNLDYSEKQRCFHFADESSTHKGWVFLKAMSMEDAITFAYFMYKKYVNRRTSGILPEISVVKLELDLFFELNNVRKKEQDETLINPKSKWQQLYDDMLKRQRLGERLNNLKK